MTLRLINEYTSHNLGDAAIYETLTQLAGPMGATSGLPADARRYVRGLGFSSQAQEPLAWVSVGGDIFNNARPRFLTRRFLQNLQLLSAPPPERTFLFGQGIPHSCKGLSLRLLAQRLRRLSSVTVRDADSHARLGSLGVKAELSWDLALAYEVQAGAHAAGRQLFEQAGVDAQRAVLLSVREFDTMYPLDRTRFVGRMAELATRLLARGHQPAVLIQAAASGADSDHQMAAELQTLAPGLRVMDPFALHDKHHALDAVVGALAQARGAVAVRFHTAVLRLLAGRQPFSLHYSVKGRDLAERANLLACDADQFDPATMVAGVEASMERGHQVLPQATDVRERFAAALCTAGMAARQQTDPLIHKQRREFAIPSQVSGVQQVK